MNEDLFKDAIIPGQKVATTTAIQIMPLKEAPDSIKADYVKKELWQQRQILEVHTEMIANNGRANMEITLETSRIIALLGGTIIVLLLVITILQYSILRKQK